MDVIVMTPTMLLTGLMQRTAKFEHIALLVLDECHHARGESDYRKIVNRYREQIEECADLKKLRVPHILGLTASLASGKTHAAIELDLNDKLDAMMARLVKADTRIEQEIDETPVSVVYTDWQEEVRRVIKDIRAPLERELGMAFVQIGSETEIEKVEYGYRMCKAINDTDISQSLKHLWILHNVAVLNENLGPRNALEFARTAQDFEQRFGEELGIDRALAAFDNGHEDRSGKLEWLCSKKAEIDGCKVIVFVGVRWFAVLLCKELAQMGFENVRELVGAGGASSTGKREALRVLSELSEQLVEAIVFKHDTGFKRAIQVSRVSEFATLDRGVLIATSVGEEGLDIEVRGVVRFNAIAHGRSLIQSRGRIRTKIGWFYALEYPHEARFHTVKNQELFYHGVVEAVVSSEGGEMPLRSMALTVRAARASNKNAISIVNELHQQFVLELTYDETKRGGPSHCPVFSCKVTLGSLTIEGKPCPRIKDAKTAAAVALLDHIEALVPS